MWDEIALSISSFEVIYAIVNACFTYGACCFASPNTSAVLVIGSLLYLIDWTTATASVWNPTNPFALNATCHSTWIYYQAVTGTKKGHRTRRGRGQHRNWPNELSVRGFWRGTCIRMGHGHAIWFLGSPLLWQDPKQFIDAGHAPHSSKQLLTE